jgi:two-component system, chemotaxis family, protein-glutamate methylesterase/glutaminase
MVPAMLSAPRASARANAVVLGASAGATRALGVILPLLPAHFPMPMFLVVHTPRETPSRLVDVFASYSSNRMVEAEDKLGIEPGVIYVAPADYHLVIDTEDHMSLSADDPVHFSRPAIDVLFESASDVYGSALLGVLLSGASEDGAQGLETIRARGGQTIAQDPATAQIGVMPRAAIRRGAAEHVLSPADIAQFLVAAARLVGACE